ncbi:MAG: bifunctional (p)ppGpp synthetase/guanosine-3',5'-bis(diphosphate) 3'-pyrophosphohydrolase [Kofleriaceae bacterium]|nr:bifunctional (p)ppGpp synthetase/guanosine-3',5'-bis(diphosphate) 3'-pyrophosphohydrolase [Kofleriaceae bacterium]MBP9169949.1 bifunctional (p)ppGpp synthetase/guanosine-3',5'-bis(diphosphate) 3'-pyrophosphohydrolase [Kofleriaceae bacterium]MBP9858347.1 bifunctional (p)ppGpp synthetase/guanosine-3',5'-bis(diphosphate) 3'-pyrophosphohydrolase [Kofleriaceae bacterium]
MSAAAWHARVMWSSERYVAALTFAADRHAGQRVPGSERPYLVHVVSVAAEVLWGHGVAPLEDPELALTCALLHDVVEDTPTTVAEVAARFGAEVAAGVAALSKDPALPKATQLDDSLARIRACRREVWAVKLADRITNLAPAPPHWTAAKRAGYRAEAVTIHAALAAGHGPLADRLAERIGGYAVEGPG